MIESDSPPSLVSVVDAGVELILNPVTATSSAGAGTVSITDTSFVQVRSFGPVLVPSGSSFSFTLPADAFVHKDLNMAVKLTAQTPAGDKLPDWLVFSPVDRRFTGLAPQGVTQMDVLIKATDADGVEANTTITLTFDTPAQ